MNKLFFGTAGIPRNTLDRSTLNAIPHVKSLGLDSMELEFVHSVNISENLAVQIKQAKEKHGVELTAHAPYYINLNAQENEKVIASKQRIIKTAKISALCGAWSICFHPAYYLKQEKELVYQKVKRELKDIVSRLKDQSISIWVRPESTGKRTQFGDINEVIKLSQDVEQVLPCIDFAHLHARSNGKFNTSEEWTGVLDKIEQDLGRFALDNMHIHLSGINYSDKGELNHLNLLDSDLNFKGLLRVWKDFKIKGIVVCESPNNEQDAILLKTFYNSQK